MRPRRTDLAQRGGRGATEIAIAIALLPLLAALLAAAEGAGDWREPAVRAALAAASGRAVLAALLALPIARVIAAAGPAAALLACLPILMPAPILAAGWIALLGRDGPFAGVATAFDPGVVALATALRWCGPAALALGVAGARDDRAARCFAIPSRRDRLLLRWRPAFPGWAAAGLLVALLAFADHAFPALLLAPSAVDPVLIRLNALQDLAGAASAALPALAVGAAATLLAALAFRAAAPPPTTGPARRAASPIRRGAGIAVAALVALLPLLAAARRAGSLGVVRAALETTAPEIRRTLLLAGIAGAIATALGVAAARQWRHRSAGGGPSLAPLLLLNLAAPPALLALGTTALFARPGLGPIRDGTLPLLLAWTARLAPLAMLLALAASGARDEPGDRAARLFGLPAARRLRAVILPRVARPLLAGGLLFAALAAADVDLAVLLVPPGTTTLGVRLDTLVHVAPERDVAAAAIAAALALAAPAALALGLALALTPDRREAPR